MKKLLYLICLSLVFVLNNQGIEANAQLLGTETASYIIEDATYEDWKEALHLIEAGEMIPMFVEDPNFEANAFGERIPVAAVDFRIGPDRRSVSWTIIMNPGFTFGSVFGTVSSTNLTSGFSLGGSMVRTRVGTVMVGSPFDTFVGHRVISHFDAVLTLGTGHQAVLSNVPSVMWDWGR